VAISQAVYEVKTIKIAYTGKHYMLCLSILYNTICSILSVGISV